MDDLVKAEVELKPALTPKGEALADIIKLLEQLPKDDAREVLIEALGSLG